MQPLLIRRFFVVVIVYKTNLHDETDGKSANTFKKTFLRQIQNPLKAQRQ